MLADSAGKGLTPGDIFLQIRTKSGPFSGQRHRNLMSGHAKRAFKCIFIPIFFINNNGSQKPNEKHVLAAF